MEETKEINKEVITCRNCGTVLRDDAIYCHECGQSRNGPWLCPNCKNELHDNQNFCPSCGVPVGPSAYKSIGIKKLTKKIAEGYQTTINSIASKSDDSQNITANEQGTNIKGARITINFKDNITLIVAIVCTLLQIFMFGGEVLSTSVSMMGISGASGVKFSDLFTYPSGLFYFLLILNIVIFVALIMFNNNIYNQAYTKYLPCIINLIMPIVLIFKTISYVNQMNSGVAGVATSLFSSLGGDVKVTPTFSLILLVVCIIATEIATIINAKNN